MLILQSVLPKFFMIDLGLWFSAHICPQVVYLWPLWACPWSYWKRLHFYFREAWRLLPPPFRNVIVRSFQYKEVLLGAPNYSRSVYWWRFLTEAWIVARVQESPYKWALRDRSVLETLRGSSVLDRGSWGFVQFCAFWENAHTFSGVSVKTEHHISTQDE